MIKLRLSVISLFLSLGLMGCSSINPFSGSNELKPAPLVDFKPALGAAVIWKKNVASAEEASFRPAVSDGVVYSADTKGNLLAIAADSGETKWKATIPEGFTAGVGVEADTIAAISEGNKLFAFNAEGQPKWNIVLPSDSITPPVGVPGLILVRTIDYAVSAYSSESGALKWRYQRQLPSLTLRTPAPVSFTNGRVYAGFPGGKVVALDVTNGALTLEGTLSSSGGTTEIERIADITGTPQYNFREVCAAAFQARVGCLDSSTGRVVWSQEFSAPNGASVDDRYLVAANELGDLIAFSRSTGKESWRIATFQKRSPSTPVVVGRALVIGDYDGYLHFIDRDTGSTINRLKIGSKGLTGPAVAIDSTEFVVQTLSGELVKVAVNQP